MIYMRLKGGMGNQMFQYAMGLRLAKELSTDLSMDLSSLLDRSKGDFVYRDYDLAAFDVTHRFVMHPGLLANLFKLKSRRLTKIVMSVSERGKTLIKEHNFAYDPDIVEQPVMDGLYEGWWQSPKYFSGVEDEVRRHFNFAYDLLGSSSEMHSAIRDSNAVCLNVRRTDFLKVDNLNTTDQDYFRRAAARISELVDKPKFFVFSDDIEWCHKELDIGFEKVVVDHSHKGFKFTNYMQLMIACQHFIIPNSSYAWWAVWLNEHNDKKVVAPKKWFNDPSIDTKDLVDPEWHRL